MKKTKEEKPKLTQHLEINIISNFYKELKTQKPKQFSFKLC